MSNTPHPAATIAAALSHWDRHGCLTPEDIATIASRVYRLAGCQDESLLGRAVFNLNKQHTVLHFSYDERAIYISEFKREGGYIEIAEMSR